MAKNRSGVLTHPPAIIQRTGDNNSLAFPRWQQRTDIKLGVATHSSFICCCAEGASVDAQLAVLVVESQQLALRMLLSRISVYVLKG